MSESTIEEYFPKDLSNRERAAFELGIKLGALFHIAVGVPISRNEEVLRSVEKGLEATLNCQPYVSSAVVNLIREKIKGERKHEFDYSGINAGILNAQINVKFKNVNIEGKLEWIEKINHPLMYISEIQTI
jgi:hypothetical protein